MSIWSQPETWLALLSLSGLEIVLGIDNLVFLAIMTARLPAGEQTLAYRLGLGGAMLTRIGLLFTLSWIISLETPLFGLPILGRAFSGRDLTLMGGGLFLIAKSTHEIYESVEAVEEVQPSARKATSLFWVVVQVIFIDIVFSFDSVITAVGMAQHISIMVTAIVLAVAMMFFFAQPLGRFVNRNPSLKVLALAFLLLIGVLLIAESLGQHLDKAYIYFAMAFSLLVELVNMRRQKKRGPTSATSQTR